MGVRSKENIKGENMGKGKNGGSANRGRSSEGRKKKRKEKKNGGLGEVVQMPIPQEREKMERPNGKK